MKKKNWFWILFVVMLGQTYAQQPIIDSNWQAIFEDEFNSFVENRWYKEDMVRQEGTDEEDLGYYKPYNANISNGQLVLTVKRDTLYHNSACYHHYMLPGEHYFSSASVMSKKKYHYGYFEIYAKLPISDGYWPSFWLWADTTTANECWYNEVDIFEGQGYLPDVLYTNAHWYFLCPLGSDLHDVQQSYTKDITNYHWYGLEWSREWIRWYCDRVLVREERNNFGGVGIQQRMHIILSVSVASSRYAPNTVTNNTIFPNYMYIDQANVYKLRCDANTVVVEIPNFSNYQYGIKKSIKLSGTTQLPTGETTCLRATDFIELTNGFEVPLGTGFFADVHDCP